MFGWDYTAWIKSEETWKELFLALARQNSVWLCTTHSSLVLEIRTWHFTQARVWTEFCLMGKVTVLLSFTSTCCNTETLCIEIFSYEIDNEDIVLTWINGIILSEDFYSPHPIEGPKNLLLKSTLRADVIFYDFIYSCRSSNKCECAK